MTGELLFVFPLTLAFMDLRYSAAVVCMGVIAAIREGFTVPVLLPLSVRNPPVST